MSFSAAFQPIAPTLLEENPDKQKGSFFHIPITEIKGKLKAWGTQIKHIEKGKADFDQIENCKIRVFYITETQQKLFN